MDIDEKAVFLAALALPDAKQREAYLQQACAGQPEALGHLRELLSAHEESQGPLDRRPAALRVTADAAPTETPGTVIGPYKLLQQIGEGGMGAVYMAEQTQPVQRKVALKVIKPGMDSRQVIARFEAERQALALMDHVNIARVFDGGTTGNGRPYFVMELVHGVPITQYCDDNHLTPRERLALFVPVCQAIQHAHQKGIIHRDIKPSNVLVTLYDGRPVPKVIDFGVAKATEQKLIEQTLFTQYGTMVGTLEYMSPEQAEMSALGVDTRSDIYSLGVLLYELLTGSTPLSRRRMKEAAYAEILRMIKEEEPPRPSTRLSDSGEALASIAAQRKTEPAKLSKLIRGELDWIALKALDKDRNRRYETASAFAADVQRYLDDEPVQACPPTLGYRLRKTVRRHRSAVLAVALVGLALVVGIIGTTWGLLRATDEASQKDVALTDRETALAAAQRSERGANEQLFLALWNQARTGRFSRQMGQRLDSLAALEKAARIRPEERLRDEALAAMALPDIRRGPSLHAYPAGTREVAFDAVYQTYARIDGQGTVSIRRIPDNEEVRRIPTKTKNPWHISMSPDGRFLAVHDEHHALQLWRVADGKPLLRDQPRPCSPVAFSSDSRRLAVGKGDWALVIDLTSGEETRRWRLPAAALSLAFHPNNGWLGVGYENGNVASVYDSARGSHVGDLPVGSITRCVVAWHPDGTRLAVAGSDPRIQIWQVASKQKVAVLEGHVQAVWGLRFHPDGSLLASASEEGVLRLWDPATGRQLMQLPLNVTPNFSSSGQWLGYRWQGGEQVQLMEATPSREYRTLVSKLGAGKGGYYDGDISPDGRLLALAMGYEGARLWDLSSGRELGLLPSASHSVVFSADGDALLTWGTTGLQRWSIRGGAAADELRLGPPGKIALPMGAHHFAGSQDGRTLAVVSEAAGAGCLVDLTTASVRGRIFAHPNACYVALSPDGRWAASSGWHSDRVRLWNAQTGGMIHEWVVPGGMTTVCFTPNSRALIISRGDVFTFWDVETLQPIRRLDKEVALYPGHVAFTRDGKLMALEMAPGVIHLKEVATARTVAKLEDPHGDRAGWMGFTPDDTRLVAAVPYAKAIHVWDLRAMRARLKGIGLDWYWPEFPPADPGAKATVLAKVEVVPGDLARPILTREQKARQALDHYRRAIQANPLDAKACNALAWMYLTGPEAVRDVKAALPLAQKAVRLDAANADYRNTLGVAYYRASRYREAVKILQANLDSQADWALGFDLYFLAMSHQRLGEGALAKVYYDWAERWRRAQPDLAAAHVDELTAFRSEVEELLGIAKK